ncbi:MAG: hypothetical protein ABI614_21335, partial [Planctomycetota bacterium]
CRDCLLEIKVRKVMKILCVVVASAAIGCSGEPTPNEMPSAPTPLSVAEWQALPVVEKYDDAAFQRLKMQDAKLKNEREWHRFMVETVIPERKKDLPGDFAGK